MGIVLIHFLLKLNINSSLRFLERNAQDMPEKLLFYHFSSLGK